MAHCLNLHFGCRSIIMTGACTASINLHCIAAQTTSICERRTTQSSKALSLHLQLLLHANSDAKTTLACLVTYLLRQLCVAGSPCTAQTASPSLLAPATQTCICLCQPTVKVVTRALQGAAASWQQATCAKYNLSCISVLLSHRLLTKHVPVEEAEAAIARAQGGGASGAPVLTADDALNGSLPSRELPPIQVSRLPQ